MQLSISLLRARTSWSLAGVNYASPSCPKGSKRQRACNFFIASGIRVSTESVENGPPVLRSHCPKPVIDVEADSDVRATLSSPAGRSTRSARASRRGTPCSRRRRRGSRDWLTIDSSLAGSRNVKPLREQKPRRVLSGRIAGACGRGRLAKMLVTARVQPRGLGRHGEPGVPASGRRKSRSARRRCCRPSGAHRRSRIRAGAGRLRPSPLPIAPR